MEKPVRKSSASPGLHRVVVTKMPTQSQLRKLGGYWALRGSSDTSPSEGPPRGEGWRQAGRPAGPEGLWAAGMPRREACGKALWFGTEPLGEAAGKYKHESACGTQSPKGQGTECPGRETRVGWNFTGSREAAKAVQGCVGLSAGPFSNPKRFNLVQSSSVGLKFLISPK